MTSIELILIWVFAPTILTVVVACILSIFFDPPKDRGGPSWFKENEW